MHAAPLYRQGALPAAAAQGAHAMRMLTYAIRMHAVAAPVAVRDAVQGAHAMRMLTDADVCYTYVCML
jgi:hypothetical protein